MYVNYYDRKIKLADENSTIGIILGKEDNKTVVEFTFPANNKQFLLKSISCICLAKNELRKQLG